MQKGFYIWKRNDGYINCTTYMPEGWVGTDGSVTSFENLGFFTNFYDAYVCGMAARKGN